MKLAKSHKIILLITAVALSLMIALCALNVFSTKASEPISSPTATNYFNGTSSAEFVDGGVKLSVDSSKKVSLKKQVVIDDMKIELGAKENIKELKITLTYDSYYINGNKANNGTFFKSIENTFNISSKDSFTINVENNVVKVDGVANPGDFYKITKHDIAIASIVFDVTLNDGATSGSFIVKSIDQDVSAGGAYKQSFELVDGKLNVASPIIALDSSAFAKDADGDYIAYANQGQTLKFKSYSAITYESIGFSVIENADVTVADNNETYVHFKNLDGETKSKDNVKLEVKDSDGNTASFDFKVVKKLDKTASDEDNKAPEYVYDEVALEAFEYQLSQQYIKDGKLVPLGTEIEIPSLKDLVVDDRTSYDKLSKIVYYSGKTENNSSTLKFKLDNVGDYMFYVTFTDTEGKGMEKTDFIKLNDNGSVDTTAELKYKDYIFTFNIDEDTEIVITTPSKQGDGYKGTRYTASKFEILSAGANKNVFKLEYSAKAEPTEEDWVEIKKFSDIAEGYSDDNYDYETLKAINYNGEYTFTPDKVGKYRITVYVSSPLSVMSSSAETVIDVKEEAKIITPTVWTWISDNVWSVVFLSVGTLCLAGIIVLLCIKPKEKKDDEE